MSASCSNLARLYFFVQVTSIFIREISQGIFNRDASANHVTVHVFLCTNDIIGHVRYINIF